MLRKIVAVLVLVPLAVILIAFAVANRQIVTVSFDPFSANAPAAAVTLPLFALFILLLIGGVLIGGASAWLRQSKWRRSARQLQREVRELRQKIDALEGTARQSAVFPEEGDPSRRLTVRPPMR